MRKAIIAIAVVIALAAAPFAWAGVGHQNHAGYYPESFAGMFSRMTQWMYGSRGAGASRGPAGNGYGGGYTGMGPGMMNGYRGTGPGAMGPGMMGGYYGSGSVSGQQARYTVTLNIRPESKKGSDGRMHDAFWPADFTLKAGIVVRVVIDNYDDMAHSLTAPGLGLNIQAAGTKKEGQPAVTTATFTPSNAGDYHWACIDPCDLAAGGWAMAHDGYMEGTISVR